MKRFIKYLFIVIAAFTFNACVHDDKYDEPNLDGFQCGELTANISMAEVKNLPQNTEITDDLIVEGYVSSSDDTGNIYKYIYLQDAPENPTQGLVVSVNSVNNYTRYPQGAKVYVKLKGLAIGTYGSVKQVGAMVSGSFDRIPENQVYASILRSCQDKVVITPKVMKLSEMVTANDQYIGCLIQVENAEFDAKTLCSIYAPSGVTVDRQIRDSSTTTARIVRNSGYASFANKTLPAGNGTFVGIYSKYSSTYQMYIVRDTDLKMNNFPRLDGITENPCNFSSAGLTQKTIAEVKQLYAGGSFNQITGDYYFSGVVTANDETGNLYKYFYVEDATGGIMVKVNKTDLYRDNRFKVGNKVYIKIKDLYISSYYGEIQLGGLYNGSFGQLEEDQVYKHFFTNNETQTITATERTIPQLTTADVGKWIKIKNVQFVESDLGEPYASGGTTNRTLKDCSGNEIILRTSSYADFAAAEIDAGQGDIYAILSIYNGTYQLWIPFQKNADFDNERCDGAVAPKILFSEEFGSSLDTSNWTAVNVLGAQVWTTSNTGTSGNYYGVMNGYSGGNVPNEDWLVSKEIDLSGYSDINLTFDSDVRYNGSPLRLFITENFTGDPNATTWTELTNEANWDPTTTAYGFVSSGNVSLASFANKKVRIAFKYVSTSSAANTWKIDNIKVKAKP